jgi:histidine triad (HIT) family protein
MTDCIFCKIVKGDIPSNKIYEDDELVVFHDIRPVAPVHLLIVPREHIGSLTDCDDTHRDLLGRMLLLAPRLARKHGLERGFRTIINTGEGGGQEVFHIHIHVFGGGKLRPM